MLRLTFALSARSADEGRSFFSKPGGGNLVGEALFDERITIASDPGEPNAEAPPFTNDGHPGVEGALERKQRVLRDDRREAAVGDQERPPIPTRHHATPSPAPPSTAIIVPVM